ncbi:nucleoside phosphorylase domain-containing protein [Aspergillus egyptiacus]|nr:nucleoside phosphorylase domain-containing protein [Aspergillus egyptiacus]
MHEAQSKFRDLGMDYFSRPDRKTDLLFVPGYNHAGTDNCRDCDRAELVVRRSAPPDKPVVHRGLIASGNSLVRDARMRDTMRHTHGVLCFEMESAGVMNSLPCLAIRGIANYADSHKNDLWQPYAALTAGAYAKDLLRVIQPQAIEKTEVALDKYMLSYSSQGAAGGTRELEYKPSDCAGIYGSRARVVQ